MGPKPDPEGPLTRRRRRFPGYELLPRLNFLGAGLRDQLLVDMKDHYGSSLVACAVFGSVGRGTPRYESDIDLLIVARDLPRGRLNRVEEFLPGYLERLRARLRELGARRIRRGNAWYWEPKPDLKPGEVFVWP